MSFRRRKREIEAKAKQNLEKIEYKKRSLNRAAGKDLFEEVNTTSGFGPFVYSKKGLKIAPAITLRLLWIFTFSTRQIKMFSGGIRTETVILQVWKLKMSIYNWSIRKTRKPSGAIGNYVITFGWRKKDGSVSKLFS